MLKLKLEIWYREPRSELLFENYFVLISEGNWPFWVWKNSISFIDFIVSAIVDSSSDDCPVPYGPNIRALDVANITLAKQIIPKNLFQFFHSLYITECGVWTTYRMIFDLIKHLKENTTWRHFSKLHVRTLWKWTKHPHSNSFNLKLSSHGFLQTKKEAKSDFGEEVSWSKIGHFAQKSNAYSLTWLSSSNAWLDQKSYRLVYYIFFKNHSLLV